jgi:hypothetical protein
MTAVDLLGFWLPLSGIFVLGLMWLMLRDTLRTPPGGGESGDDGGGSDRLSRPRPPWSWSRRGGHPDRRRPVRSQRRPRARR